MRTPSVSCCMEKSTNRAAGVAYIKNIAYLCVVIPRLYGVIPKKTNHHSTCKNNEYTD